jgi:HEAT repeat protein
MRPRFTPGNKRILLIAGFSLLLFLVWAFIFKKPSEPVCDGKSLSYWLVELTDADDHLARERAASAIRTIGTNAVPTLLQMLRGQESSFQSELLAFRQGWYNPFELHIFGRPYDIQARAEAGFAELGPRGAAAVPELIKILEENQSRETTQRAATILGNIGPDAKLAVPALLRAAVSTNTVEHFYDFEALGKIHSSPDIVIPVLARVISNSRPDRIYAVQAAGQFRSEARAAVPSLVVLLNDPSVKGDESSSHIYISDRTQVERALQKIDPETYERVVTQHGAVQPGPPN